MRGGRPSDGGPPFASERACGILALPGRRGRSRLGRGGGREGGGREEGKGGREGREEGRGGRKGAKAGEYLQDCMKPASTATTYG